jgi:hypothetical protein
VRSIHPAEQKEDRAVRIILSAVALLSFAAVAHADQSAISQMLTKPISWTMYIEYTDAAVPSDRAQRMTWHYFVRDGKVMGRQLNLAFGGCEFDVAVRADGFGFAWCPPYRGEPSLDLDLADPVYPFKSRNPRKMWMTPDE